MSPSSTPPLPPGAPDSTVVTTAPSTTVDAVHEPDTDVALGALGAGAVLAQRSDHREGLGVRDREADVGGRRLPAPVEHRGVDADDLAGSVDERPAGVARRDRGVGLDQSVERAVLGDHRAVERRHDAERDRRLAVEVEREADRHHLVADTDRAGFGEASGREPGPGDAQEREVVADVDGDQPRVARLGLAASRTRIFDASTTTCAFVTISPSDVVMIPVPIDSPASSPLPTSALIVTTDGPTASATAATSIRGRSPTRVETSTA